MKRLIITLLAVVGLAINLNAFDWQPKTNEELFDDMMSYARGCCEEMHSIPAAGKLLDRFIAKQQDVFLDDQYAWIQNTYDLVYALEKIVPPHLEDGSKEAMVRRHMFRLLDFPIHVNERSEQATPEEKEAWASGRNRNWDQGCKRVAAALDKPAPPKGTLEIIKLYNMGYILRTSQRCIGIDLCWKGSRGLADKVAAKLDAMFVTHPHGDHYTKVMLEAILDAGKVLVLSKDYGPADKDGNKIVTWDNIIENPVDVCGIKMRTVKGHQNKQDPSQTPNNIYYLEFDGFIVLHHGDNSDREAQRVLSSLVIPDLAFVATWNRPQVMMELFRFCKNEDGREPLFISSHENEYGHRVQQRESYWETYTSPKRYGKADYNYYPWMTMECGETYRIKK